jgi:glyoxylase-like metal-dependent hydrolase (beta-lactamase superfamily II)
MTRCIPLHENVSLVGSGELGLSHYLDCHVYLLHDGDEHALIDAGSGLEPERLLANLREAAGDLSRIRLLLLTHCHGDHAGGAHALRSHCDFRVASSPWEIRMLEQGSDEDLGLVQARFAGTYPADYKFTHSRGDIALGHGDRLKIGSLTVEAIHTPGHTRGSVCYQVSTGSGALLFSGDTVFSAGLIQLLNTPGSDISEYRRSVQALADRGIDCLFPGHGLWALRRGQAHIDKMLYYFRRSAVPPMPQIVEKVRL